MPKTKKLHLAQQEIYLGQMIDPQSSLYNIGGYTVLKGQLNMELFKNILEELPSFFDVFSMRFSSSSKGPSYHLEDKIQKIPVEEVDLSHYEDPVASAKKWIQREFDVPFNIETDRLCRFTLLKISEEEYWWQILFHHLIIDGFGFAVLINHVTDRYDQLIQGTVKELNYPSYVETINKNIAYLSSKQFLADKEYWESKYKEVPKALVTPKNISKEEFSGGERFSYSISASERSLFERLTKSTGASLPQLTIAALLLYFGKTTAEKDISIGTPVHNRGGRAERNTLGMFVSVLAYKGSYDPEQSVLECLAEIKKTQRNDIRHRNYPISFLNRSLSMLSESRQHIFDVIVNYEPLGFREKLASGIDVEQKHMTSTKHLQYPLSIRWCDYGAEVLMELKVDYMTRYFSKEDIVFFVDRLFFILRQFEESLANPLNDILIVPKSEQQLLLKDFESIATSYKVTQTVVDLFRCQVLEHPEAEALVFGDSSMTYQALDAASNQLANHLLSLGVTKEQMIPLCMERSFDLVIGVLGILKSGGAYVPIDPKYPQSRIDFILEDTKASLVLTASSLENLFENSLSIGHMVRLDELDLSTYESAPIAIAIDLDQLMYVIYTSGTTGVPKGVLCCHGGVSNLAMAQVRELELSSQDSLLQFASVSFDAFGFEVYAGLIVGARIVIVTDAIIHSKEAMGHVLKEHQVSVLTLPPTYQQLLEDELSSVRVLVSAGEPLLAPLAQRLQLKGVKVINGYGPTENSVCSTWSKNPIREDGTVTIGSPLPNTETYVLDEALRLVPIGVVGELCLAGVQLAKGYLGRPELTKEKFVAHPFKKGERLYKTGDLARWFSDGTIEFIGRKDDQIKIRGYRVELGEIETALDQQEVVAQSVVVLREDDKSHKELVAYLVPSQGAIDLPELKSSLQDILPDYMLPSAFVVLEAFPLTTNGKVAKNMLPAPDSESYATESYVAPSTSTEIALVGIWEQLLSVDKIGVNDNFFSLGGDSIQAIQLVSLSKSQGIHYAVKDLFKYQSIGELSKHVSQAEKEIDKEEGVLSGALSLHPIQQQFFEKKFHNSDHYNQSVLLNLSKDVSFASVSSAANTLLSHHDALRLCYTAVEGSLLPTQFYGDCSAVVVSERVDTLSAIATLGANYQSSLNISKGDLVRFVFIETPDEASYNRLLIVVHHLGIDGVSWRILLEDLNFLLANYHLGVEKNLPSKGSSYRQWVSALELYGSSLSLEGEFSYWSGVLSMCRELPVDKECLSSVTYARSTDYKQVIDSLLSDSLLKEVHAAYGTDINDILLSALSMTLSTLVEGDDFVIALEGHGREELFSRLDINRTVGWFTSLYPFSLPLLDDSESIGSLVATVKDRLRMVPAKGIGYGVLRYLSNSVSIRSDLSVPFESIVFNYLGSFESSMSSDSSEYFHLSTESIGSLIGLSNQNPHKIAINGFLLNGCLQFSWSYSKDHYEEATIVKLAYGFKDALACIVTHCCGISEAVPTRIDYSLPLDISFDSLQIFKKSSIHPCAITDIYPLSPLQEGMLFHSLYDEGSNAYVVQLACDFVGALSFPLFLSSWRGIISDHTILRTGIFKDSLSVPVQCVYESITTPVYELDFRDLTGVAQEDRLRSLAVEEQSLIGLSMDQGSLFRISLVRLSDDRFRMFFTNHHILWDGWSLSRLFGCFVENYQALYQGGSLPSRATDHYGDYIRYLAKKSPFESLSYWRSYMGSIVSPTFLPFLRDVNQRNKVSGNSFEEFCVPLSLNDSLHVFTDEHRITVNTFVQGAWGYLLSKYTGQDSVCFGVTISGRDPKLSNITDRVGLYINTIPLCMSIRSDQDVVSWLQSIQSSHTICREEHGYVSLRDIIDESSVSGELFDSLVVFENYPIDVLNTEELLGFGIENIKGEEATNYTLSLSFFEDESGLSFKIMYHKDLISNSVVQMIAGHLQELMKHMLVPNALIDDLSYLTIHERDKLSLFSNTLEVPNQHKSVIGMFLHQVRDFPDRTAITFGEESMSYEELHECSDKVACYLQQEEAIIEGSIVGVYMERSIDLIVGILGILKTRSAYVSLDPSYPSHRLQTIISESRLSTVLTSVDTRLDLELSSNVISLVTIDSILLAEALSSLSLEVPYSEQDAVYILYTSGSTGVPKGVTMCNTSLVNLLEWQESQFENKLSRKVLQFASINFDVSFQEIASTLCFGHELVMIGSEERKDMEQLIQVINIHAITHLFVPFVVLESLALSARSNGLCPKSLEEIITAGEQLRLHSEIRDFIDEIGCKLINQYGPSETHVVSSYPITNILTANSLPSIGKPISNTELLILDDSHDLVAVGVIGELCVSGVSLANGYLHKPELTKEKFVAHPFKEGERLYKTGDLARWFSDGTLEFIGRKDDQVKIRGYRVELGEIETALDQQKGIAQSVVVLREDDKAHKALVAYLVLSHETIDFSELKSSLQHILPDYMLPSAFVELEELPLTPNGKVAKQLLPTPNLEAYDTESYVAPSTSTEISLAGIWQDLLSVDKVGIYDNFFALGGHSLLVIKLLSRIKAAFTVSLSVSDVFSASNLFELSAVIVASDQVLTEVVPIVENRLKVPLSSEQQRLWFLSELGQSDQYIIPLSLRVRGVIDSAILEKSLNYLVARHESLRTTFRKDESGLVFQEVRDVLQLSIVEKDMIHLDSEDKEVLVKNVCRDFLMRSFDLEEDDLIRSMLVRVSSEDFIFCLSVHHIIFDGWSLQILMEELTFVYELFLKSIPPALPDLRYQYLEYANWQLLNVSSGYLSSGLSYWEERLSGHINLSLPVDYKRPNMASGSGNTVQREISFELKSSLTDYSQGLGGSLFTVLLSSVYLLLHKFSGQEDICIGIPTANRSRKEFESIIGFFVNTFVSRLSFSPSESIRVIFERVLTGLLSDREYEGIPFEKVVEALQPDRDTSVTPFFQVLVNYLVFEGGFRLGDTNVCRESIDYNISKFDLEIEFVDYPGNSLTVLLNYNTDIYKKSTAERMLDGLVYVLEHFVSKEHQSLRDFSIVSDSESLLLLKDFQSIATSYKVTQTVVDLFRCQVLKHPEAEALVFGDSSMTYQALDAASNQLANHLLSLGVTKEQMIPLCMERSFDLVIGVLGILKSGGAYVPIDPKYPQSRIDFILEDTKASLVLTASSLENLFENSLSIGHMVRLDELDLSTYESAPIAIAIDLDQLMYVIYTSGTTGVPKGVLCCHGGVSNLAMAQVRELELSSQDSLLQFASVSFDVFGFEIYASLIVGARVVMVTDAIIHSKEAMVQALKEYQINVLTLPPTYQQLLEDELPSLSSIRFLISAGEPLLVSSTQRLQSKGVKVINAYGPTENSVCSTWSKNPIREDGTVTIGSPLPNTEMYVLDEAFRLVPIGVVGELCLAGVQLAKGYLGRPELTKEKFVAHPFKKGERLYKTGDLARWFSDGTIEFIGRKDDQIKIRGYRVELGEIETALDQQEVVAQSVVVLREDDKSHKELVAYLVPSQGAIDLPELKSSLQDILPDYMLPSAFVVLEAFPLTTNGKVAKNMLPAPDSESYATESYVAPSTSTEIALVGIWEQLLSVDKIGVNDNFFSLGGDSIQAIQLVSLSKSQGIHYAVKDLFKYQSIGELSKHVSQAEKEIDKEEGVLSGALSLHPIQQQFFEKKFHNSDHYNQSVLLNLSKDVSFASVSSAANTLLSHHDALRLCYTAVEGSLLPTQFYGDCSAVVVSERVDTLSAIATLGANYQSSLNISKGDLVRFVFIETPDEASYNRLLIVVHHLGIDGVSWRILLEDLNFLLANYHLGVEKNLPSKGSSYRQWVSALELYGSSLSLEGEFSYWSGVLSMCRELPVDKECLSSVTYARSTDYKQVIDSLLSDSLLKEVHAAYGTDINDILLSALSMTLSTLVEGDDFVIALEGHGREELFSRLDINRTVGWFTSLYPFSLPLLDDSESIGSLVATVKDRLRMVPAKGIGYGVLRYLSNSVSIRSDLSVPFESIVFNYLGSFESSMSSDSSEYFHLSTESIGSLIGLSNQNPHKIAINGFLLNGCLQFSWSYSKDHYEEATIVKLAYGFKDALACIVTHCCGISEAVPTRIDYSLPLDISFDSLQIFKKSSIHPCAITDIYPLSPLQEGMLFHSLYDEGSNAYVVQLACDFVGALSFPLFLSSWRGIISDHTILRTGIFKDSLSVPVQCVYESITTPVYELDFRDLTGVAQEDRLRSLAVEEQSLIGLSMDQGSLFRISLVRLSDDRFRMFFTNHHILWDGWSLSRLFGCFVENYQALYQGGSLPSRATDHYGDYIRYLAKKSPFESLLYWRSYMGSIVSPTFLPFLRDVNQRNKVSGNSFEEFCVPLSLNDSLHVFTDEHRITVNTFVQGAWGYLLSKYTGQDSVCFGVTISGRDPKLSNITDRVGLYINTIPLCMSIRSDQDVVSWLQSIQSSHTICREEHGYVSLRDIIDESSVSGELFDSLVVFENYPIDVLNTEELLGFGIENIKGEEATNYTLSLSFFEDESGLSFKIMYHKDLISNSVVQMIAGHLQELMKHMLVPNALIDDLSYLTIHERDKLSLFSNTLEVPNQHKSVIGMFLHQVRDFPDRTAITFGEESMSYEELHECSDKVACYLQQEEAIIEGSIVGVYMERSIDLIVGILGILKTRSAYVSLDPSYPSHRLQTIISESRLSTVLTSVDTKLDLELSSNVISLVTIDSILLAEALSSLSLEVPYSEQDAVYILYTSGSTGVPKGVTMCNTSLVNLLEWQESQFENKLSRKVLQFASINFDVSFQEIASTLCFGHELVMIGSEERKDMEQLIQVINIHAITHLFVPFVVLESLALSARSNGLCPKSLEEIITAGEQLRLHSEIRDFIDEIGCKLINQYGPSETHVVSSYPITNILTANSLPSIGKPISNTELLILDDSHDLVAVGVIGELCVSGVSLANGYLHKPELTKEKFVAHPFKEGERLYKTGDLARWFSDGTLEFIGRKDDQVKIRGYRVELGEIETALDQQKGIAQSVVVLREDDKAHKALVAYLVLSHETIDFSELKSSLQHILPDYMLPSAFVELEELPLTPNGKVAKQLLPTPNLEAYDTESYVAPSTSTEISLAGIWQDLLSVDKVGIYDNFFALGGHSLLVIKLLSRIKVLFEHKVTAQQVFQFPVLKDLSRLIENSEELSIPSGLVKISKQDDVKKEMIFCAPGAGGNIVSFYALAEVLENDYTVYGFQAYGLDGITKSHTNIKEIATQNIKDMQAVDPEGPYRLAGYSMGASVAHEMTLQLQEKGFEVSEIISFDGLPNAGIMSSEEKTSIEVAFIKDLISTYNMLVEAFIEESFFTSTIEEEELQSLNESEQLDFIYYRLVSLGFDAMSKMEFHNFVYMFLKHQGIWKEYLPNENRKYHVPVTLFRAEEGAIGVKDEDYGWSHMTEKEVTIYKLSASHMNLLNPPHVYKIAEKLKENICKRELSNSVLMDK